MIGAVRHAGARRRSMAIGGACLALIAAGCEPTGEPTEIMANVYWDLSVDELDAVAIRVFRMRPEVEVTSECNAPEVLGAAPGECMTLDGRYYVHRFTGLFPVPPGEYPLSIGIAPRDRDPDRIAYVEAFALECGDEPCSDPTVVARTGARTRFVEDRITELVLWLSAACIGVTCPPEHDCRRGVCRPRAIPVGCTTGERLMDAGAGAPPRCDEGDSGVPSVDGGSRDAGPDTEGGTPDDGGPLPDTGVVDAGGGGGSCPGECAPGEVERRGCGNCGREERRCGNDCRWNAWGSCEGEGECTPGDSAGCSTGFDCSCGEPCCSARGCRECNDSCTWEWVFDMCEPVSCCGPGSCTDAFGDCVPDGEQGWTDCPTTAGCVTACTCSSGSWTACEPGCAC